MKKLLLNLYLWPAFFLITVFGIALVPAILLLNVILFNRGPARALRLAIRFYGWVLVCLVPFSSPVRVIGNSASIPRPSIIVANHNSAIDPYLFGAIPIENCFVTSWPFKIPIYGLLMKLAGYINTNDGWDTIKEQCINRLRQGSSITIWPEGHRSRNGMMGRFRKGAFQLAVESGYPIQPVCIFGSERVLAPGRRLLSPGRIKLVLLEPLYPKTGNQDQKEATAALRLAAAMAIRNCLYGATEQGAAVSLQQQESNSSVTSDSFNRQPHDFC